MKRQNNFCQTFRFIIVVVCGVILSFQQAAYGQTQPVTTITTSFWSNLDASTKVVAAVVAAITAILGVPVAFLQTRKTIAEIRKLELETEKLREQTGEELFTTYKGHQINLLHSDSNSIQIFVDPRFTAPLLILLDFVIAYITLALAGYSLKFVQIEILSSIGSIVLLFMGVALFLPLLREALRLRETLRTEWESDKEVDSE